MLKKTTHSSNASGFCAALLITAIGCAGDDGNKSDTSAQHAAAGAPAMAPDSADDSAAAGKQGSADSAEKARSADSASSSVKGKGDTSGSQPSAADDEFAWPADCEAHYKLLIYKDKEGTKYDVGAGQEIHPQVMITPPWSGDVQAVAFRPITDNTHVLHHWILYSADGAFLTGWAPGADGTKAPLPADVGMYLPSSGQMRLDVHYNNVAGTETEQDASGVEVCVITTPSKFRANTATVIGLTGNATAPAHQHVDNATTCTVNTSMGSATLVTQSPHMHQLGVHAKLELIQDGETKVLHDKEFSFDNQISYPFADQGLVVKTGDQFTVTCGYTNNSDKDVHFGQNTEDEMCFNFVSVYPKGGFSCRPAGGGLLPGPSL